MTPEEIAAKYGGVKVSGGDGAAAIAAKYGGTPVGQPHGGDTNPSNSLPIPKAPTPTGLRPGDAPPAVPTAGMEALRNLPASIANATTGFGPGTSQDTFQPHGDYPGQIRGPSFQNVLPNIAGTLRDTASSIGQAFRHPIESFARDPIGEANTLGSPAQIGQGIYSGIKAATAVEPRVAGTRAFRPPPSNPDFAENLPSTMATIKAANPGFKPRVENGQLNVIPAAERAIAVHQDALQLWLQRMEGTRISGTPIVDATRSATQGMLPSEGHSADSLVDRARLDYQDFSPQQLRDRLSLLNQRLSSFYNQAPGRQSAALADIPDAVLKAQRDAAADTLYRHLDPENEGAGPRLIQSRTGNLIDLRDAALRRNNAIVAEQPMTPFGKIMDPIKGAIRHLMPTGKSNAGLAFAEGSEGRSLPLIRRAFNAVDENEGANELGSLPRPGPRLLNASADTSGPVPAAARDFSSAGSPFAPRIKLLPAATSPIGVSGVIAPDFAGEVRAGSNRMNAGPRQLPAASIPMGSGITVPDVTGQLNAGAKLNTGGARNYGPRALLPAPAPGQPPINILPRGPGAIGPGGTVPELSTESPIPAGGIKGGRLLDYLRRGPRLPD